MYFGGKTERFISGEQNCLRIMSTRCGRIGISWTLHQRDGLTFPLRHKIPGPNSWKKTTPKRSNLATHFGWSLHNIKGQALRNLILGMWDEPHRLRVVLRDVSYRSAIAVTCWPTSSHLPSCLTKNR